MIDLRHFGTVASAASILDFVPESIVSDVEVIALARAIDPQLQEIGLAIVEAVILPRIDEVSEPVLDEIGWSMRLNELQLWDTATVAGKRAILDGIFKTRKKSGTPYALRKVFSLLEADCRVVEWFDEGADPHTYRLRVIVTDAELLLSTLQKLSELTHRFSRASQHLSQIDVESEVAGSVHLYPALTTGQLITIPYGGP
jgi:phage tail P2-like protein